ncbi:zinc transporter ZntB [Parasphingopyxis marina]|uniref:Zinc transporter ZntB n=1 Tax=Parasphingopyxis marina TaxID=2761622 RepID=A0A842HZ84_9SPHN|nr:zinc transporter ZntB [Parasphingopyxis marina]MBC2778496.1 zinc transporter ZntB [Parasphingopyxis marina]
MDKELAEHLPLDEADGLIFACLLDGEGGADRIGWEGVESWTPTHPPLWIHVNSSVERVRRWLPTDGGLTEPTSGAMLSSESRPRVFHGSKGFVAILRGINLNPGTEVEDLVSLHMWSDGERLITVREEKLNSTRNLFQKLVTEREGPHTIPQLYVELIDDLTNGIGGIVAEYDDQLDDIEERTERDDPSELRQELGDLRQEVVGLRRFLAPQREALNRLMADPPGWLGERLGLELREIADRTQRHIEEIDVARERALVLKDDIANRLSEQMNRNMYVLSIVAAIFLPLSFITGLLGINVGGMPGVSDGSAFWLTCAMLAVLLGLELIIFRWLKWM